MQPVDHHDDTEDRCGKCRYWFERCCHALALAEKAEHNPRRCGHFATLPPRAPAPLVEIPPC